MDRRIVSAAIAAVLAAAGPAFSEDKVPVSEPQSSWPPIVIQVKDRAELIEKFCAADPNLETSNITASIGTASRIDRTTNLLRSTDIGTRILLHTRADLESIRTTAHSQTLTC